MAHYDDLSEYSYVSWAAHPGTRNIGWLAPGHEFATAVPGEELLDRLWRYCNVWVAATRGIHDCELCTGNRQSHAVRDGKQLLLGTAEIRVFAASGEIYAAPTLIYHYVADHHYAPPEPFVRAVAESPAPPDPAYFARLDQLGVRWHRA